MTLGPIESGDVTNWKGKPLVLLVSQNIQSTGAPTDKVYNASIVSSTS